MTATTTTVRSASNNGNGNGHDRRQRPLATRPLEGEPVKLTLDSPEDHSRTGNNPFERNQLRSSHESPYALCDRPRESPTRGHSHQGYNNPSDRSLMEGIDVFARGSNIRLNVCTMAHTLLVPSE